ncbi:MAG: bifunctional serine/threonine-protein kinase/formylglycine-generating enzyme family protein [Pseudomonadota bacterium]|nr:bifunctional serine/threonine-protein kinase/formylglycine-generating enzyme family protein [Pseudomonadota bacterium]
MSAYPENIGKYKIVSVLGRGAMGTVFQGIDTVIDRNVAIKTVARGGTEHEQQQLAERFKREAQAAGRLSHPNIVAIYEYAEEDDCAYIAMEFVDGETLAQYHRRSESLGIDEICSILARVLDGLDYAHARGVVHRDIKPSNIMLTGSLEVKVTDFGIARLESSAMTQLGAVLGTPGYMSPEQLLGQPVDQRTDIFSCGILLYELLTGERAFPGNDISSIVYNVVHADLPPPSSRTPDAPEDLDAIVAKALAKKPADRFQSAREFAQALRLYRRTRTVVLDPDALDQTRLDDTRSMEYAVDPAVRSGATVVRRTPAAPREPPRDRSSRERENARPSKRRGVYFTGALALLVLLIAAVWYMPKKDRWLAPLLQTGGEEARKTPPAPGYVAGEVFSDCPECPRLVVLPPGEFMQGSPDSEAGRQASEGPEHPVRIEYPFALGQFEVTLAEFGRFAEETGYRMDGCRSYDGEWNIENATNWLAPGFTQDEDHPVTCVSWSDAMAYVEWLSQKTGATYRLPSESEWEYAARAGSELPRPWAGDTRLACGSANVADLVAEDRFPGWEVHDCADGYVYTAPAGSFRGNSFGLYDTMGNAFEWVADCWRDSYAGASSDGKAWTIGDCSSRVLRGGSWFSMPKFVRSAFRNRFGEDERSASFGFRVAREL